jgi:hypothetical protein
MNRQDRISVFTEAELRTALALTSTPDSAAAVAAQLYALPPEELIHFQWIEDTLLQLSCVSDDLAQRVVDNFASSPEERARLREKRTGFCEWVRSLESPAATVVELEDVVYDSRRDVGLTAGMDFGAPRTNFVALFTEAELREALSLIGAPERAAAVAAQLYALQPEEQAGLRWTDLALGLLSIISTDTGDRVISTFGTTSERVEQLREMKDLFRSMAESSELKQPDIRLALDTVVRSPDGGPPPAFEPSDRG